jgi:hypothetical protein
MAFGSKVMIPGASTARADGRIQFARFQPGIINGCRPAHAVFELARQAFGGAAVVESFPQLTLGPLAEFAAAYGLPMIARLAGHKTGSAHSMLTGQQRLNSQVVAFLDGLVPRWLPAGLTTRARADGYDAVLGLLPGIVWAGYVPPAKTPSRWQTAVMLRNLLPPIPAWPVATVRGCRQPEPSHGSSRHPPSPAESMIRAFFAWICRCGIENIPSHANPREDRRTR